MPALGVYMAGFLVYLCLGVPVGYLIAWKEVFLHIILLGSCLVLLAMLLLQPESSASAIDASIIKQPLVYIVKLVGYMIGLNCGEVAYANRGDIT